MVSDIDKNDEAKRAILRKLRDNSMPAAIRLTELIAETEAA
jgi:hypothetical protein